MTEKDKSSDAHGSCSEGIVRDNQGVFLVLDQQTDIMMYMRQAP